MIRIEKIRNRESGFTLMEVLVALSIFSIAMTALSVSMSKNITNAIRLQDKTLASWLASNKMVELESKHSFPKTRTSSDKETFALREWVYETKGVDAGLPGFRQVEVSVGLYDKGFKKDANFISSSIAYFSDVSKL